MTTTSDVRDALDRNLNDFDTQATSSPEGLRVSVDSDEIGLFEMTLRKEGLDELVDFKKRRGDRLIAEFDVETTIVDLFR